MITDENVYEPEYLSENAIHSPQFDGLKADGFRIGMMVVIFIIALVCIRYGLSLTSPTAKAITIVFVALFIALFAVLSLYMGWL